MRIRFNRISVLGFKSYLKETTIEFGEKETIIEGRNGSGKSTIGDAISWVLYGTDLLGNTLDPTNLFTRADIEASLLLSNRSGQELELTRGIKSRKNHFKINDVPVKATEFKQTVESLFTKDEFLTLFNPLYYFTQHWTNQRAQLLTYIQEPLNQTILERIPGHRAKLLANELKKMPIDKVEAKHRLIKKETDITLVQLRERIKTLEEMNNPGPGSDQFNALYNELETIQNDLKEMELQRAAYEKAQKAHEDLVNRANYLYEKIQAQVKIVEELQQGTFETHCNTCGQELTEEGKEKTKQLQLNQLQQAKERGKQLVSERKSVMEQLKGIQVPTPPQNYIQLQNRAMEIQKELGKHRGSLDYTELIQTKKDELAKLRMSHIDSVDILDAITQFKQEKALVMVQEVNNLFENIGVKLYETMKNGEEKATFEIEYDRKPFSKLSNAEKIKCGLEFREIYAKLCKKDIPVIIDNFESISGTCKTTGQVVTMAVKDKELEIKKA